MTDTAIYDTLTTTQENRPMTSNPITVAAAINGTPPATPPIEVAFADLSMAIERLENILGDLNSGVMRAGAELAPILTGGTYADPDDAQVKLSEFDPTPEDRRSTIARRIDERAAEVNRLASASATIADRLRAILANVEL